jgi:hypothetical protein
MRRDPLAVLWILSALGMVKELEDEEAEAADQK